MPHGAVKKIKRESERWKRRGEERGEGTGQEKRSDSRLISDKRL